MSSTIQPSALLQASAQDQALVADCLKGNELAWSALVDKYKNLIFSIPLKHGFSREDSAEVFQEVCLTLLCELPNLREPQALAGWLIQITNHRCWRFRTVSRRASAVEERSEYLGEGPKMPDELLLQVEREEILRQAMDELPPRCHRLVDLLFLSAPEASYDEIARRMGSAKGSIGSARMRCLEKLHSVLKRKGFC